MMLQSISRDSDLFALQDLWKPSTFSIEDTLSKDDGLFPPLKDLDIRLPNLENFQYGSLEIISAPESLPGSVEQGEEENKDTIEDDIWRLSLDARPEFEEPRPKTWETFRNKTHVEPHVYLSEAGPRVFDAWIASSKAISESTSGKDAITRCTAKTDQFLHSLLSLGLGRESAFFRYDAPKKTFCARRDGLLPSGYSLESIDSITKSFINGGNSFRALDAFAQRVYESSSANSTTIAFAQALSAVTRQLRAQMLSSSGSIRSLLQLQSLFATPFVVVSNLIGIQERLQSVNKSSEMLSILFDYNQTRDDLDLSFRSILLQVMARVSVPWLRSLESLIGLRSGVVNGSLSFCSESASKRNWTRNDEDSQPYADIITDEGLSIVNEISQSRRILETHLPDHILSRGINESLKEPPSLDWGFGWNDIERIQAKATLYERSLLEAMNSPDPIESAIELPENFKETEVTRSPFDMISNDLEQYIAESQIAFEHPPLDPLYHERDDPLAIACRNVRFKDIEEQAQFTPPLSIVPSLSFSPIIAAQARLVNLACLRLVFTEHKLQQHLSIQHRFHLLGDGVFVSRFSHALFDPDLPTSQRRKNRTQGGTVGLNLGFRESWPPATSELRLALVGILKDCVRNSDEHGLIDRNGELPGGLNFSIRDLSEEEIEKCLDPDSVEALDFLRLQYKPPPPLDTIFTQSCLDKYDQIFKFLLRLTRMMSVVNQLHVERARQFRSRHPKPSVATERFRIDAYRFISTISAYFAEDGVTPIWSRFESSLRHIASRISRNARLGDISEHDGLRQIRETHERVLDQIKFILLSRKRQEKAMQVLEDIFRSILLFAKETRKAGGSTTQAIESLYRTFKAKVGAFILLCRELSVKKGLGAKESQDGARGTLFSQQGGRDYGEENTLSRLLLKLEMNGYFNQFCKLESALIPNP